jgi:hypothetical protein
MIPAWGLAAAALLCAACATDPLPSRDVTPPLPTGLAGARDLRAPFRAAFCARESDCEASLYRFAGEAPAVRAPVADPARFRLLFVPGFLASCFPDIHTFGDVMTAARAQGFAVDYLDVEGRGGIAGNAQALAQKMAGLPDDGRHFILVAPSTHCRCWSTTRRSRAARPPSSRWQAH